MPLGPLVGHKVILAMTWRRAGYANIHEYTPAARFFGYFPIDAVDTSVDDDDVGDDESWPNDDLRSAPPSLRCRLSPQSVSAAPARALERSFMSVGFTRRRRSVSAAAMVPFFWIPTRWTVVLRAMRILPRTYFGPVCMYVCM